MPWNVGLKGVPNSNSVLATNKAKQLAEWAARFLEMSSLHSQPLWYYVRRVCVYMYGIFPQKEVSALEKSFDTFEQ